MSRLGPIPEPVNGTPAERAHVQAVNAAPVWHGLAPIVGDAIWSAWVAWQEEVDRWPCCGRAADVPHAPGCIAPAGGMPGRVL